MMKFDKVIQKIYLFKDHYLKAIWSNISKLEEDICSYWKRPGWWLRWSRVSWSHITQSQQHFSGLIKPTVLFKANNKTALFRATKRKTKRKKHINPCQHYSLFYSFVLFCFCLFVFFFLSFFLTKLDHFGFTCNSLNRHLFWMASSNLIIFSPS